MDEWNRLLQRRQYNNISDTTDGSSPRQRRILTGLLTTASTVVAITLFATILKTPVSHTNENVISALPLVQQSHDSSEKVLAELPIPASRCQWVRNRFFERDGSDPSKQLKDTYEKQTENYNVFYRATAHLFWYDYAGKWGDYPRALLDDLEVQLKGGIPLSPKSTWTWVTGDQHLSNFGAWRNRHEDVVFGVNDFDEAAIFDFHVDVLRIAVSICNHAVANHFSKKETKMILRAFTESYVKTIESYVGNDNAMLFELTPHTSYGKLQEFMKDLEKKKSSSKQLKKFTTLNTTSGERYFVTGGIGIADEETKLAGVSGFVEQKIRDAFTSVQYGGTMMKLGWNVRQWDASFFRVLDVAERVGSGIGSFGVSRYYVLLDGSDSLLGDDEEDGPSVILDVKYEPLGAVERVLSDNDKAWYDNLFQNRADRVTQGQRQLTSYTDPFTGWVTIENEAFSVRQRSPWKDSMELDELVDIDDFTDFVAQIAIATATSHVRGSPAKQPADFKTVMHAILGDKSNGDEWGAGVENFSRSYHEQVMLDYRCFSTFVEAKYTNATET